MRTIIPPFRPSNPSFFRIFFLIVAFAFLAALPITSDRTSQHFKIQSDNYLRAPDSVGAGAFEYLTGFQFDSNGNLFVSDSKHLRTLRFAADGNFLSSIPWEKGLPEAGGKILFIMGVSPHGLLFAIEPVVSKRVYAYNDRGAIEQKLSYEQKEYSIWDYVFVDDHTIAASIKEMTV
jgi:hypothetical protein